MVMGRKTGIVAKAHLYVVDKYFSEAVWQHVLGLFSRAVTNGRHSDLALEASSDSIVDTLRLAP